MAEFIFSITLGLYGDTVPLNAQSVAKSNSVCISECKKTHSINSCIIY